MIDAAQSIPASSNFPQDPGATRSVPAAPKPIASANASAQDPAVVRAASPPQKPPPPPPPPDDTVQLSSEAKRAGAIEKQRESAVPASISQVVKEAAGGDFRALARLLIVG